MFRLRKISRQSGPTETATVEETPSLRPAKQYLSLGGTRKSKIDDNITDTRIWDDEPEEAAKFWKEKVEVLREDERKQGEDLLPSINDQ
ncbi:hypothetical protein FG152_17665 [Ochrobactrum sp. XJ1]|nr:hypothetical protein [Ochrobactrum sp. XJ1]